MLTLHARVPGTVDNFPVVSLPADGGLLRDVVVPAPPLSVAADVEGNLAKFEARLVAARVQDEAVVIVGGVEGKIKASVDLN